MHRFFADQCEDEVFLKPEDAVHAIRVLRLGEGDLIEVILDAKRWKARVSLVEQGKVKDIFANPKTKTTRDFIKNVLNDKEMVKWSDQTGKFHLHFTGKTPEKPLLSTIAKKFNVEFNIFAAGISLYLADEDVGYMNADIMGSDEEVSKVIAWLEENSVHVRKEQE